jgi:uncharacterized protein YdhG (YjbR/CyaY superfamily)
MMATASETSGGSASPNEVDLYIQAFPEPVREKLEAMRRIIREEVPQAREKISYRMPTYELFGNLVHFAGYARHIGFYPTPSAIEAFKAELASYKNSKGAVQFPIDKALPENLIRKMVRFRVAENTGKK